MQCAPSRRSCSLRTAASPPRLGTHPRRSLIQKLNTKGRLRCTPTSNPSAAAPTVTPRISQSEVSRDWLSQKAITFQDAVARLQQYWSSAGCAVWLPHNTEVGAGTMNPATFLRVLGPEPWNVCYAEPSIRPDDSRYGENPNRIQRHTQFQVILKPDPGNPQELYLKSLEALGIDTRAHDIRFVEDNWESPVLGAWGLGWEVWLDGMEITQFTYFQQAGSLTLPIPAIEITYGLERILMSLQNVHHFKDIQYTDSLTYGELLLQTEIEMSQYNMDEAVVEHHWQRFSLYKEEAQIMLEKELALPAYDSLLKCSHTFNILDARGAVGVTERNVCFGAMRKLTRQVASLWVEQRTKMEFPLLKTTLHHQSPQKRLDVRSSPEPRLFVLEVGCEEMPPDDVDTAVEQLKEKFQAFLDKERLQYHEIDVQGTTRRLTVFVFDLVGAQAGLDVKVKGPPSKIAYEADGSPSKALIGFCKKNNCSIESVSKETDRKGIEFMYALRHEAPKNTAEVLTEQIPELLRTVTFKKSMRWSGEESWSRPIRWILALHGAVSIPLSFAQISADNATRLLRSASRDVALVRQAEDYVDIIRSSGIVLARNARREKIWRDVREAAKSVDGVVPEKFARTLLGEVVNLVEVPSVLLGAFSPEFLSLPKEVLETVMQKYQRYFPIYKIGVTEEMLPFFASVGNGEFDEEMVRTGYEDVLRARFKDAQFFYHEDLKHSLKSFRPKLAGTLFHKNLGNLLDKSERTQKLIRPFSSIMKLESALSAAERAAEIARADLATSLVTEMTSLAGIMGRHYALKSGEDSAIAEAIFEASLPRFAGDLLPSTPAGLLVSVADKMDSLVGLIAVKCAPSATADPFGLRRMAYGLVAALIQNKSMFNCYQGIDEAAALQPVSVTQDVKEEVALFIQRRLEQFLLEDDITPEIVRSVLEERRAYPYLARKAAMELMDELRKGSKSTLPAVMTAMGRATRIAEGQNIGGDVDPSLFEQPEEKELWEAYQTAKTKVLDHEMIAGK